jgi:hypothetical protein
MLLARFDMHDVDAFVDAEVFDLVHRFPPDGLHTGAARSADEQLGLAHDQILRDTIEFLRDHKPGFFQKSHLAHQFKRTLHQAHYPDPFVHDLAAAVSTASVVPMCDRPPAWH